MMSIIAQVAEHRLVQELRSQLATTPRLRWLVFAVFILLMSYVALVLDDSRNEIAQDYQRIAARAVKLESLEKIDHADFKAFLASEQAANSALRARFWMASSRGLAGAELQSWLRHIAAESNLAKLRLDLSEVRPVTDMAIPLWQLKAELTGQITPSDARAFLAALARSERVVTVESLSYSPFRGDLFSVQLAAYFIIETDAGEAVR